MGLPFDHYAKGKLIPKVGAFSADRNIYLPDYDLALDQWRSPLNEGFEGAAFPPSSPESVAWATPSPRFPSDQAWYRDTVSVLSGTASANRKSGQLDGQNSSLGCTVHLFEPARVEFLFKCISEDFFDFGEFWLDGVLMMRLAGGASPGKRGRYVSQVLDPGTHNLDWRFTKDGSATQAGELFLVDDVKVVRESQWRDTRRYLFIEDDFAFSQEGSGTLQHGWLKTNTGASASSALQSQDNGVYRLSTGTTAGCSARIEKTSTNWIKAAHNPRIETRLKWVNTGSHHRDTFGLADLATVEAGINYDGTLSANWRLKLVSGGVTTYVDTGTAVDTSFHVWCLDLDANGFSVTIDGKSVCTGSGRGFWGNASLPATAMRPWFNVNNIATAADSSVDIDFWKLWATRL